MNTIISIIVVLVVIFLIVRRVKAEGQNQSGTAEAAGNLEAAAEIKKLLFADQSVSEMVGRAQATDTGDESDPFSLMARSVNFAHSQDTNGAIAALRSILALPDMESRMLLWTWNDLRQLGVLPDPETGNHVLGVIVEAMTSGGLDTLAAYADGRVRYINHTGAMIVWETEAEPITSLCQSVIDQAQLVCTSLPTLEHRSETAPAEACITLLTPNGLRAGETSVDGSDGPLQATFMAATQLLVAIVDVTRKS